MATSAGARASLGLLLLGAGLAAAAVVAADRTFSGWIYLGSTIQLAIALGVSRRVARPDWRIWTGMFVVVVLSVAGQILDRRVVDGSTAQAAPAALFLLVQVVLVSGLLFISWRRLGSDPVSVLADGTIVAAGSWFLIWWWVLQPTIERSDDPWWLTATSGATLSVSAIVLFTLATILFGDADRSPAVWLVAIAIAGAATGDVLWASGDAGRIQDASSWATASYVVSLFAASAAFVHPSVRGLVERGPVHRRRPFAGRMVVTTLALAVPVVALSLTDPASDTDRWVRTASVVALSAAVTARVGFAVRANARMQRELERQARTDALTGLPNRALVAEQLTEAIRRPQPGTAPAVLFIDIDRFKNINDSLGHQAGDDVLVAVAERLRRVLPPTCSVGRISGDEFTVVDHGARSADGATALAERVVACFHEPLPVRQGDVFVTASIGVAIADGQSTAEDLLRQADTAMYRAKQSGRNCIAVFDASMLERASARLDIETALHRALERREVRLVHQPIVDLDDGTVSGFEALMRWEREDGTSVSPAEFIPIAEETGTIVPLGSWAILEALVHLRGWIDRGACLPNATISVNVSPRQLHDPAFAPSVEEALRRAGVPATQLWIEVTEGVMLAEPEPAIAALRSLVDDGVRVAVDDFGTGYSSLSLLRRFPVHRLKIDRSFVSALPHDASALTLVRTIVAMSRSLNLEAVAEGVETPDQLEALVSIGCTRAQGYLLSHPVPPASVPGAVAALSTHPHLRAGRRTAGG
ncbi:MAG: bifunctional diguanylate cyclase/phosphodiesterase [Actinobacteria bacterium]|nr:bifunctional diguanylate cyclase/phosphodiesterase [Actinomycetota bacterium]